MSIEQIMAQSPTPRTHSIWNALVNSGSNPVETGRILGAARKMEMELQAANERIKRLEDDLSNAYAEMRKQYPAITAVFDRSVWTKAKEAKP